MWSLVKLIAIDYHHIKRCDRVRMCLLSVYMLAMAQFFLQLVVNVVFLLLRMIKIGIQHCSHIYGICDPYTMYVCMCMVGVYTVQAVHVHNCTYMAWIHIFPVKISSWNRLRTENESTISTALTQCDFSSSQTWQLTIHCNFVYTMDIEMWWRCCNTVTHSQRLT